MHKGTYYHQSQQNMRHHTILVYTIQHRNINVETHMGENHKKRSSFGVSCILNALICAHNLQTSLDNCHYITFVHTTCGSTILKPHEGLFILYITTYNLTDFFKICSNLSSVITLTLIMTNSILFQN